MTSPPETQSEQRYRMLFDRAPVGILYADAGSYYVDANECICRMLRYTRDELIGLHASDIVVFTEVPRIQQALDDIATTFEHRREWQLRRKDGTVFPAMVTATRFPDGALLGMVQDISELKAVEEARRATGQKLRSEIQFSDSMIESMPGIVYLYDYSGRLRRWNRNLETVSGHSPADIACMHPLDFIADADKALVKSRIADVFACGESCVDANVQSKDGTVTPYFFTGRRVLFEGGHCLIGMGIDIAALKGTMARLALTSQG